ncbi:MAG: C40 family peptidase [Flavobacteriales bacterium]|nr:C40 family peptidase [Flavobacteriales bacterium]MCB9197467.1 C40 family peptidase [Flavobacteriales bacterium]
MRYAVLNSLFLIGFLCFQGVYAQDKKVDKLEMLYDQGNYKIVLRKSSKMLHMDEYKNHPAPVVFHALSEYQLSKYNEKFSSSTAIYDYEQFMKLDSGAYYRKAYANYIYDLQTGIAEEIQVLTEQGHKDKAKVKYDTYQRLFGNIAGFEEMTTIKPVVTNTELTTDKKGIRSAIIKEAEKHIGTPYKYGGITTQGFDCSGFTQYVFSKNGITLPRTAGSQATAYEKIKIDDARQGDLVFFGRNKNEISHVGIVFSNGDEGLKMIHASTSRGVMVSNVNKDPYWFPKLQYAVKVIKE